MCKMQTQHKHATASCQAPVHRLVKALPCELVLRKSGRPQVQYDTGCMQTQYMRQYVLRHLAAPCLTPIHGLVGKCD